MSSWAYLWRTRPAGGAALGQAGGSGGQTQEDWTARLLAQPLGVWLVALVGLVVIGAGLYQLYYGISGKFRNELKLHKMSQTEDLGDAQRAAWSTPSSAASLCWRRCGQIRRRPVVLGRRWPNWRSSHMDRGCLAWLRWCVRYGIYAFVQARYRRILCSNTQTWRHNLNFR